jgi:tetratricopeptide (TPR) repeat protein
MEPLNAVNNCSVSEIGNIFLILLIILIAGFIGGAINAITQQDSVINTENTTESQLNYTFWQCVLMGIGASLLVPLFLETISSNLIHVSRCDPDKYLVIMGFAIVASISSRTFIKNISNVALKNSEEAKRTAVEAVDEARNSTTLMKSILYSEDKQVDPNAAITKIEKDMAMNKGMQLFADAWAWKGYYQKRAGHYDDAVKSLNKAIVLSENKGNHNWSFYYNSACYKALAKHDINSILDDLRKAIRINSKEVINNLQTDKDFDEIKKTPEFMQLLSSFTQEGDIK